jgi:hypothetical protein
MKSATKVIAHFLYAEGMGSISDITDTTFWIEGKRKNKVEVAWTNLSKEIDLSGCCLCADFTIFCIFDKLGDNVVLVKTAELQPHVKDSKVLLVDLADVIIKKWAVEFLPEENSI